MVQLHIPISSCFMIHHHCLCVGCAIPGVPPHRSSLLQVTVDEWKVEVQEGERAQDLLKQQRDAPHPATGSRCTPKSPSIHADLHQQSDECSIWKWLQQMCDKPSDALQPNHGKQPLTPAVQITVSHFCIHALFAESTCCLQDHNLP